MAITINYDGFPYMEPNHLSAPRTGQVYASLPAANSIDQLENGRLVKYDYANGEVNFTGEGPWMLVFNEEKLYDERKQSHKDFAMKREDSYDNVMVPRVFALLPGDIFTTNCFHPGVELQLGDKLRAGDDGWLEVGEAPAGEHAFQVVKEYTMPDGQPGVKVQVIR